MSYDSAPSFGLQTVTAKCVILVHNKIIGLIAQVIILANRCATCPAAGPQPGGVWDPQAIQDIVNTLFWLHCKVNVSESKIIVIHKAVYILRNLQLETVIPNRCHLLSLQSTEQFISYATFDLCYLLIVVIHDVLSSHCACIQCGKQCFLSIYIIILLNTNG